MQSYANTNSNNNNAGPSASGTTTPGYSLGGPSGSYGGGGVGAGGLRRLEEDVGIGRYKDKYDESLNPFEAFKGRVSDKYSLLVELKTC